MECLDFTINAMKYAQQRVSKKEQVGGFSYPLNYMMHERLLNVYLDVEGDGKSYLTGSFQDQFFNIQHFSQTFLGVKSSFQLIHIMKHVFNNYIALNGSNLEDVNFAEFDENQNRALYTIKTLMVKITKEYPNALKQRLISLELITDKKIQEPIDYYSQTS